MNNNEQRAKRICKIIYWAIIVFIIVMTHSAWVKTDSSVASLVAISIFYLTSGAIGWWFIEKVMKNE